MRKKKMNSILAGVLALAMVLTSVPMDVRAASNLALNKAVSASNYEVSDQLDTRPTKAVDGDLTTRWGTDQNRANGEWIEVNLGSAQTVKKIVIHFERTDANQNILGYHVDLDGATVYTKTQKAAQKETIVLAEARQASTVKVTIDNADGGSINWVNVGINEIEVYSSSAIDTPNVNHVRSASMSASTVEDNLETFVAAKAGDGDTTTRWSSVTDTTSTPGSAQWLKATFTDVTQIKQINVKFHKRDVNPQPNNIAKFSIKYTDENGNLQIAKSDITLAVPGDDSTLNVSVVLNDAIYAKDIQLCDFEVQTGNTNWNSVGVVEFEAYSNALEEGAVASLAELVTQLEAITDVEVSADVTEFELPEVPEGYTIKLNGADFEQIIGNDLTVVHPLTDKVVQVSYEVSDGTDTKITNDITYVVKGTQTQTENKNAKPVVIPEIQEWYSDSTDKIAVSALTKVTYDSEALEAVVDEFIADYEDLTGVKLEKAEGNVAGAFNFSMTAPDALLGEEGYTMNILADRINVASGYVTGNMYGAQTILQMVTQNSDEMPVGQMRDYPRFEVRGLLLDIARKPIGMEMIREIARTMRYYKMNDFQLHLSDNYIFLENYGKGANENEAFKAYEAFRLESGLTNAAGESPTAKDYAISKAEMREFIQSQRALGMEIVPEIDMPAHATSFTKIWPELMVQGEVSPLNSNRPLVDHFDVTKQEAIDKIKEIFDDYTTGANPTFDEDTIVHVGADEFVYNYTAYRQFVNQIVPHVKQTNKVRMWGGFTWIKDNPETPIITEAIEGVEMNLWSKDWADGIDMYNMGYKLINTIDDYGYMVPNGSLGRANAYGDLLNVARVFDSFEPNKVRSSSGYVAIPSGDDQALGAVFAIWSDNIDKHSSGLTESDLYYRFFDALPFYAEKTWAATGKEKGSADALANLAQELGTGPRTNPYYQADRVGDSYAKYTFENGLEDATKNNRDLAAATATVENGALNLKGGNSYVTSPMKKIGNGNELIFDITLTEAVKPGDILFETTPEYGTHDIRIMENGKLGFTRELHNYYFDYTIPVGETVNIKICAEQQDTILYVNGELVGEAVGKFIHNGIEKKTNITHSTFAIPVERIGSATNAIAATIDNVVVKANTASNAEYDYTGNITYAAGSEQVHNSTEGIIAHAFDGNPNTYWHSAWNPAWNTADCEEHLWVTMMLEEPTMVDAIRYLPRPANSINGNITGYRIEGTTDGTTWTILTTGTWTSDGQNWKLAEFEPIEVLGLKLVATATTSDSDANKFASAAELRVRTYVEPEEPENPEVPEINKHNFTDVKDTAWYADEVQYVFEKGIMTGTSETTFEPAKKVSRAVIVTTLYKLAESPVVDESFDPTTVVNDYKANTWWSDAVKWALYVGVATGNTSTNKFEPSKQVTRQELATFLERYARLVDGKTVTISDETTALVESLNVPKWAKTGFAFALETGIITGITNGASVDYAPKGTTSRAQLATMLYRYCQENNR